MRPALDRARWERVSAILDAALELEPKARARYLDEACGGDVELRSDVDELLVAAPEDFLGVPAVDRARSLVAGLDDLPSESVRGQCIVPYRLPPAVGGGGRGVVYLADS